MTNESENKDIYSKEKDAEKKEASLEEEEDNDDDDDDDDENYVIREATIQHTSSVGGVYKFHFQLEKGYEYKAIMPVKGKVLHIDTTTNGSNDTKETKVVGVLNGSYIDRNTRPCENFHSICDFKSDELRSIGCTFFRANGTLRYDSFDGLSSPSGDDDGDRKKANHGGFLHVEMIKLDEPHRHQDLGISFLIELLRWINDDIELKHVHDNHYKQKDVTTKGWTICILEPGTAYSHRDDWRFQRTELTREEKQGKESKRQITLRKIRLQYVRLGFRQASFGSSYFYLLPGMLKNPPQLKGGVANTIITEVPTEPINNLDEPLMKLMQLNNYLVPLDFFQASVDGAISAGSEPSRCHALHLFVANMKPDPDFKSSDHNKNNTSRDVGSMLKTVLASYRQLSSIYSDPEVSKIKFLLSKKININEQDVKGNTAIHIAASRLNPDAAKLLLKVGGVNLTVRNIFGKTPLEVAFDANQDRVDWRRSMSCGLAYCRRNGGDDEKPCYEIFKLLLDPSLPNLHDDIATPRMMHQLQFCPIEYTDDKENAIYPAERADGIKKEILPSEDFEDISWWDHIPLDVKGANVHKKFAYGYSQIVRSIESLLTNSHCPTVERVKEELDKNPDFNRAYTQYYFDKGGLIEYALDGLINTAYEHSDKCDGIYRETMQDDDEFNIDDIPAHPLDDKYDFLRYYFVGPKGKIVGGPHLEIDGKKSSYGRVYYDDD